MKTALVDPGCGALESGCRFPRSRSARMAGVRAAFTLIEVLVVVAIIALLISILIPSLTRAKENSRQAVCLSNLHQLGVAMLMYETKYRCFVPVTTEKGESGRWPRLIGDVRSRPKGTDGIRGGLLQLATCPTVPERARALKLTSHRIDRDVAYGYNYIYLGDSRFLYKPGTTGRFPVSPSTIKYPARMVAIADSEGTGGWCPQPNPYTPDAADPNAIGHHGFMIDPPKLPADATNGPAYDPAKCTLSDKPGFSRVSDRHRGGSSVLFVDGHANWVKRDLLERDNSPWNGRQPEP